jgi:hypothetical protein
MIINMMCSKIRMSSKLVVLMGQLQLTDFCVKERYASGIPYESDSVPD